MAFLTGAGFSSAGCSFLVAAALPAKFEGRKEWKKGKVVGPQDGKGIAEGRQVRTSGLWRGLGFGWRFLFFCWFFLCCGSLALLWLLQGYNEQNAQYQLVIGA